MSKKSKEHEICRPPLFKASPESIKALSEAFKKAKLSNKKNKKWTMEIHNG
ncbi:hypothetical protein [Hahella sp. CCB-MM4]|uniref:hypothetical protein n=1 Tax=Hahella sp. (strain CCB-MM4) TaxID=1926491 RepID=UPI00143D3FD0|nr:hypothetical protein [Hahella sp. CCB-MM4]